MTVYSEDDRESIQPGDYRYYETSNQPQTTVLLNAIGQALEEILSVQRRMLARIEEMAEHTGGVSSVELDSNGRAGELKIKVKRYEASETPVDEALADYAHAMRELRDQQMNAWQDSLKTMGNAQ